MEWELQHDQVVERSGDHRGQIIVPDDRRDPSSGGTVLPSSSA